MNSDPNGKGESLKEIGTLWLEEAERRFAELRDGVAQGTPASEGFAKLRASLSSRER